MSAKRYAYCIANREGRFYTGAQEQVNEGDCRPLFSPCLESAFTFPTLEYVRAEIASFDAEARADLVPCEILTKLLWKARQ